MRFTTSFRMKLSLPLLSAALLCCLSCVNVDYTLGDDLIPQSSKYTIIADQSFPLEVDMMPTDSLSGFSNLRMSIGAIRDEEFGLSKRSCAFTLVPLDTLDFGDEGTTPEFINFHFEAAMDTVTVESMDQTKIFQSANVYALKEPISTKYDYDCNGDLSAKVDWSKRITLSRPVLNGTDSLSFDFTEEFGKRFFSIKEDEKTDIKKYLEHFPGVYITVDDPVGFGGRFNHYTLQLGFDADYYVLSGNYATLRFKGTYNGVKRDTAVYFYYSPIDFFCPDSLVSQGIGSLSQYCLNLTSSENSAKKNGNVNEELLYGEGGGGAKPVIKAEFLRRNVMKTICDTLLARGRDLKDTSRVIITKATLEMPFVAPDKDYKLMFRYPLMLSPTVRTHVKDTTEGTTSYTVMYSGITDASNSSENQGTIDRSNLVYSPDITYHLQEILSINFNDPDSLAKDEVRRFKAGEYDIWLMNMAYEEITTTTATDSEMSDYYTYLAYQSYYSSIYGGYSGSSSYGDPYSNYYSYMLASMYASGSNTSTSSELMLDIDRYYKTTLCGPSYYDARRRPKFKFSFIFPNN